MELTVTDQKKSKAISTLLFVGAIIVAIIGAIMFILGVMFFVKLVESGKAQEMDFFAVIKYFGDQGNLSSLFEPMLKPIALYGGISLMMFAGSHLIRKLFCHEEPAFDYSTLPQSMAYNVFGTDENGEVLLPVEEEVDADEQTEEKTTSAE